MKLQSCMHKLLAGRLQSCKVATEIAQCDLQMWQDAELITNLN